MLTVTALSVSPALQIQELFQLQICSRVSLYHHTLNICGCCSVAKLCLTLCDPMDCDTLGPPVLHYLPEFAQNQVHWISDATYPSHLLLPPLLLPSIFPSIRVFSTFASGGRSIGASASALVFPINVQGWFPLGLTGLIPLLSKGLSRLFSSITVQNLQFFGAQPSLWSDFHIYTWLLEKIRALTIPTLTYCMIILCFLLSQ